MKKFLTIALCMIGLAIISPPVHAQTPIAPVSTSGASKSTLTNADTAYLTFRMLPVVDNMVVQITVTKTSGTVAGTITPQYSIDGVNYIDDSSPYTVTNVASQTKIFTYTLNSYLWYRYRYTTTGTQVSTVAGRYLTRTRP